MFKNEVIERYMHCIMHNFFLNAQICIYSLADLNIGNYVELTFLESKLGKFLMFMFDETLSIPVNKLHPQRPALGHYPLKLFYLNSFLCF